MIDKSEIMKTRKYLVTAVELLAVVGLVIINFSLFQSTPSKADIVLSAVATSLVVVFMFGMFIFYKDSSTITQQQSSGANLSASNKNG
jgi:hypothetical protein